MKQKQAMNILPIDTVNVEELDLISISIKFETKILPNTTKNWWCYGSFVLDRNVFWVESHLSQANYFCMKTFSRRNFRRSAINKGSKSSRALLFLSPSPSRACWELLATLCLCLDFITETSTWFCYFIYLRCEILA